MKLLSRKTVLETRAFSVVEDQVALASGKETSRNVVRHPGAVIIVPVLDDGKLLLVKQYRHAIENTILEFPAGTLEKREDPLDCAKRELIEETNHSAKTWISLGIQYPAPGFCNEIQYCYLAKNLSQESGILDEDEIISTLAINVSELESAIKDGHLNDAKSISALLKAKVQGYL